MATVSADDIAESLGRSSPPTEAEAAQWERWIDGAFIILRSRLGNLDLLDQDTLNYVVTEAVALRVRQPDGATSVSVAVDDGSVTRRYESSTGQITILPEWWDLLRPEAESVAFSTRPTSTPDYYGPYSRWGRP